MEDTIVVRNQADGSSKDAKSDMDQELLPDMETVINALRDAGFEPYDQLVGYVLTGNPLYITSRENARAIVTGMDREMIRDYLTRNGKWLEVFA